MIVLLSLMTMLSGLFAGFLLAMATVVQKTLEDLPAEAYAHTMQRIIVNGRASRVVLALVLAALILGLIVLVLLAIEGAWDIFALALVGGVAHLSGGLLVSRYIAEPVYDTIMAWDVESLPQDWADYPQRWFRINQMRLAGTWIAFLAFGAATLLQVQRTAAIAG